MPMFAARRVMRCCCRTRSAYAPRDARRLFMLAPAAASLDDDPHIAVLARRESAPGMARLFDARMRALLRGGALRASAAHAQRWRALRICRQRLLRHHYCRSFAFHILRWPSTSFSRLPIRFDFHFRLHLSIFLFSLRRRC